MLNKVILMGRLTRDPDLRRTAQNTPVASFTLAIDRDRKGQNGEKQTDFIDCVAWGRQAAFVANWFERGMLAIVVGRIQSRQWEDKNGSKRVSVEVNADEIQFGETKKSRGESYGRSSPQNIASPPEFPNASDSEFTELADDSDVPF